MKATYWCVISLFSVATASAQMDALSAGRAWQAPVQRSPPTQRPAERPHPAIVRIISTEKNGLSLGSGSLVAVSGERGTEKGIILTNWHVVRDGNGQVTVVFADGVRKAGRVLKMDSDWDLAAIEVDQPHVAPVELANAAPRRGERLSIAGYGPGPYRAASGRCTQFLSPGGGLPFDIVELSVAARQGDSGGPILNERGELAGVLFGATRGTTSGSHCGRVKMFLDALAEGRPELSEPGDTMLAALEPPRSGVGGQWVAARRTRPPERLPPVAAGEPSRSSTVWQGEIAVAAPAVPAASPQPAAEQPATEPAAIHRPPLEQQPIASEHGWTPVEDSVVQSNIDTPGVYEDELVAASARYDGRPPKNTLPSVQRRPVRPSPSAELPSDELAESSGDTVTDYDSPPIAAIVTGKASSPAEEFEEFLTWQELAGRTAAEQFKSILAVVGIVGLFLHGLRCLRVI
ncbi:MAG: serine protease [Pirellulales bacterium]